MGCQGRNSGNKQQRKAEMWQGDLTGKGNLELRQAYLFHYSLTTHHRQWLVQMWAISCQNGQGRLDSFLTISAKHTSGGDRNSSVSSVLGSLSCVMQRCGFDPPLSFQQRGFSLGANMGSDSPKTLSDESINRGLACAHKCFPLHQLKDPDIHVLDGWMLATKTPNMCHPRRRNVTTSMAN